MADTYELADKLNQFDSWQQKELFYNTGAIQLNTRCSIACRNCGLGATPGSGGGDTLAYDLLEELSGIAGDIWSYTRPMPYFASDTFDYESQGHNIRDAYKLLRTSAPIYTAVPFGREDLVLDSLDIIDRITIRGDRRDELEPFLDKLRDQFAKPPGYNLEFMGDTGWRNLGPHHSDNLTDLSLACFHGVLLTPTEIYSIRVVRPTPEHPYGMIKKMITPDNFKVPSLCLKPNIFGDYPRELDIRLEDQFIDCMYHEFDSPETQLPVEIGALLMDRSKNLGRVWAARRKINGFGDSHAEGVDPHWVLSTLKTELMAVVNLDEEFFLNDLGAGLLMDYVMWIQDIEADLQRPSRDDFKMNFSDLGVKWDDSQKRMLLETLEQLRL